MTPFTATLCIVLCCILAEANGGYTIEVYLAMDKPMQKLKPGLSGLTMITDVFSKINQIFAKIKEIDIQVTLAHLDFMEKDLNPSNPDTMRTSFSYYINEKSKYKYDMAILFTGDNVFSNKWDLITGPIVRGGVTSKSNSKAIVEATHGDDATVSAMAHVIGHLLNIKRDKNTPCGASNHIMNRIAIPLRVLKPEFSKCSIQEMVKKVPTYA